MNNQDLALNSQKRLRQQLPEHWRSRTLARLPQKAPGEYSSIVSPFQSCIVLALKALSYLLSPTIPAFLNIGHHVPKGANKVLHSDKNIMSCLLQNAQKPRHYAFAAEERRYVP